MTKYLAGVLSVIAAGVLLIAYGLLNPRVPVFAADGSTMMSRPMYASDRVMLVDPAAATSMTPQAAAYPAQQTMAYPVSAVRTVPDDVETYQAPRRATVSRPVSYQPERPVRSARSSGRDWKKTAMIIGGSSAAGAGIGAIFGGKKGALIGAALGGGGATVYQITKR